MKIWTFVFQTIPLSEMAKTFLKTKCMVLGCGEAYVKFTVKLNSRWDVDNTCFTKDHTLDSQEQCQTSVY